MRVVRSLLWIVVAIVWGASGIEAARILFAQDAILAAGAIISFGAVCLRCAQAALPES